MPPGFSDAGRRHIIDTKPAQTTPAARTLWALAAHWARRQEGRDRSHLSYGGHALSKECLKQSLIPGNTKNTLSPFHSCPTHSQLGKPWGLLRRLLVWSVCQGGNDALAVAEEMDLQHLDGGGGRGKVIRPCLCPQPPTPPRTAPWGPGLA